MSSYRVRIPLSVHRLLSGFANDVGMNVSEFFEWEARSILAMSGLTNSIWTALGTYKEQGAGVRVSAGLHRDLRRYARMDPDWNLHGAEWDEDENGELVIVGSKPPPVGEPLHIDVVASAISQLAVMRVLRQYQRDPKASPYDLQRIRVNVGLADARAVRNLS